MCSLEAILEGVPGARRRVSAATKALPNANQSDSRKKVPTAQKNSGASSRARASGVVGGHGRDFGASLILLDPPESWVRTGLAGAWAPARCGAARRDTVRLE